MTTWSRSRILVIVALLLNALCVCVVFNLANNLNAEATQAQVDQYRLANRDSISRNQERAATETAELKARLDAQKKSRSASIRSLSQLYDVAEDELSQTTPKDDQVREDASTAVVAAKPEKAIALEATLGKVSLTLPNPRIHVRQIGHLRPWLTDPLDTVQRPPYVPTEEQIALAIAELDVSGQRHTLYPITEQMAAGGVSLEYLVQRALAVAFKSMSLSADSVFSTRSSILSFISKTQ